MLNKMKMMIMVMTVFAAMVFSGCQMATSVSVPEVEKTFYDELREIYSDKTWCEIDITDDNLISSILEIKNLNSRETCVLSYENAYAVYKLLDTRSIQEGMKTNPKDDTCKGVNTLNLLRKPNGGFFIIIELR